MSQEPLLNLIKEQTEIRPGMMFWEVLNVLTEIDGGRELNNIEADQLRAQILSNVDWAYEQRRLKELEVQHHEELAQKHREIAGQKQLSLDRFDTWLLNNMQASGTEELRGEEFVIKVSKSEYVQTPDTCTEVEAQNFPDYVRVKTTTTYAWDKPVITKALKYGFDVPFASLNKRYRTKFDIKKGN